MRRLAVIVQGGMRPACATLTGSLTHELAQSALVYIGRGQPRGGFFSRVPHLVNHPTTRRLPRRAGAQMMLPTYPPAAAT